MTLPSSTFGPPAVAIGVVRELRSTEQVRLEAVMGVLSLYILLGMLFAFTYGAIARFGLRPTYRLHRLVCDHVLGLRTAQRAIAVNWVSAYRRYVTA